MEEETALAVMAVAASEEITASAKEKESDEEKDPGPSPIKSKKRYLQYFNEKWLEIPEFRDWLSPDPNDKYRAICRVCNKSFLSANRYSLMNHKDSAKHKKNAMGGTYPDPAQTLVFDIEMPLIPLVEGDKMAWFQKLFGFSRGVVIGVLHVPALPGTPCHQMSMAAIVKKMCHEAREYAAAGITGLMLKNTHDVPYLKPELVGPEITASMTAVSCAIRQMCPRLPLGVQVLSGANKQALAIAQAAGLDFIRAEGFVFSHVGEEGQIDACAGELLRYRRLIGAQHIKILTDIKTKHSSHSITSDVSFADAAKTAEFFKSDGVIVTGTNPQDVEEANMVVSVPVLLGSGVTIDDLHENSALLHANGCIVGSHFKHGGLWHNDVDFDRVKHFMTEIKNFQC